MSTIGILFVCALEGCFDYSFYQKHDELDLSSELYMNISLLTLD